jgi:hypothetical protein
METQRNLLESAAHLQNVLRQAGIDSMVVGGLAIAAWGEPRATKDADLKVLLQREQAKQLLSVLTPEYELLSDEPEKMLLQLGFVFTRHPSGVRIDLLLAETGFDLQAMKRRRQIEPLPGISLTVCSPEDLIIYKMISTRARDQEDARGVIRLQAENLDHDYVEDWLRQFEMALDDSTLVQSFRQMRKAD